MLNFYYLHGSHDAIIAETIRNTVSCFCFAPVIVPLTMLEHVQVTPQRVWFLIHATVRKGY